MRFRDAVAAEFQRRRRLNPRFSLRGFSRIVGLHHSTVSRLLRASRPVPARTVKIVGARIGLSRTETAAFAAIEDVVAVARAIDRSSFRPDSRWLASVAGISVDRVNISLQTLLRCGQLRMLSRHQWVIAGKGLE